MSYDYLWHIALILISTKILGLITRRFQMPQVVGALLAGLLLGPAMLGVLQPTDMLTQLAELGVIVIMFSAGMGTNIKDLGKSGKSGFMVALIGVLAPLLMGTLLAFIFNRGDLASDGNRLLQNIFMGTILTATSVSITVETLQELGKLHTKVGNTILAAAIIDDILGLIALTIVTSFAGENINVALVILKIVLFFIFVVSVGYVVVKVFNWYTAKKADTPYLHRYPVAAFVLCLLLSFLAERVFGVADIIGAFAAGLIVANTTKGNYISSKFQPVQYLFLTPIFFANIGLKVTLPSMSLSIILFAACMVVVAILSKLVGCGLGAKVCHFSQKECIQIGLGMACRGEVALIVANKGASLGLMPDAFFGPVIITVVCCAVLTPVLLKISFKKKDPANAYADLQASALADRVEENRQLDIIADKLLTENRELQEKGASSKDKE